MNEEFYHQLASALKNGVLGTCALALRETTRPDMKQTRSALSGTVLRLGDTDTKSDEAFEIIIKTSKCTAVTRPKGWKKFAMRVDDDKMAEDDDEANVAYAQLKLRSEYYVDRSADQDEDEDVKMEEIDDEDLDEIERAAREKEKEESLEKVEKEELVRGFKYGTTYAPCPDGLFPRLPTRKGVDICGFFPAKNVRPLFPPFHDVTQTKFSSAVNSRWVKSSMFGVTLHPHHSKSHCPPLYKPCTRKM